MTRRTDIGLHIITNGERDPREIPWKEFKRRVEAAAAVPKKAKGNNGQHRIGIPGDGSRLWAHQPDERRCQFVKSKTGARCKNWAMKGGTRCRTHGGYRELPEHPATIRKLGMIQLTEEKSLARKQLRRSNPHDRQHVEQALTNKGLPLSPITVLQGIEALNADDNGKAWRRFIKHAETTAPSTERKAKKKRLMSRPERPSRDTTKPKDKR